MLDVLREIAQRKREEVLAQQQELPQHEIVQRSLEGLEPRRNLRAALSGRELRLIAEVRRPPPEALRASLMFDPRYVAQEFAGAGAAALSVFTDHPEVGTEAHLLRRARRYMALPVIAWDYFVDEYQIYRAWDDGADAVALIVGLVDDDALQQMVRAARKLRMEPVPVIRDNFELDSAMAAGAEILAVENRDVETGEADLSVTERLARHIPGGVLLISAHGITTRDDAERMAAAGADAALFEPPHDYERAGDAIRRLRGVTAPSRDETGMPRAPERHEEE
ncbi:MAG: indole-3-glycerol phosphate synthase TrpC [Armatimonadota bacterium]